MSKTLAIIDGDSLCYLCSKETIHESIESIDSLMKKILDKTGSTSYYLFLSEGKYFRHAVNKEYKGKRSKSSPLKFLRTLKKYLREQYFAEHIEGVEADDAVAYIQQKFLDGDLSEFTKTFVCAMDKDVKRQVVGNMYDYRKDEFSSTTAEEAIKFLYIQAIMGDSTDNIKGVPGLGEKKAGDIIAGAKPENYPFVAYQAYLNYYKKPGEALFAYQQNFRQVYILRTDNDFIDSVGFIPLINEPVNLITE